MFKVEKMSTDRKLKKEVNIYKGERSRKDNKPKRSNKKKCLKD
jgi:hypothetical protein